MNQTINTKIINIAVTGHRPNKLWGYEIRLIPYQKLKNKINKELAEIGESYDEVICMSGMALGADTIFALTVLEMNSNKYKLECAVPCNNQSNQWCQWDRNLYNDIIAKAHTITMVSNEPYKDGCMQKRNQYMVNKCDILIAVYNGDISGGTFDTIQKAIKANKKIIYINPKEVNEWEASKCG